MLATAMQVPTTDQMAPLLIAPSRSSAIISALWLGHTYSSHPSTTLVTYIARNILAMHTLDPTDMSSIIRELKAVKN